MKAQDFELVTGCEYGFGAYKICQGRNIKTNEAVSVKIYSIDNPDIQVFCVQQEIKTFAEHDSPFLPKYYGSFIVAKDLWIVTEFFPLNLWDLVCN